MELYDVMRTTFAARDFTDDELPDDTLYRILDNARFAPSGGNRQGGRVIVVKNPETKRALGHLCLPALRVYGVQRRSGESPWQSVRPTNVDVETVWNDESIRAVIPMFEDLSQIPTVLVIAVDLEVIASMDQNLDRVGIISGGSISPWLGTSCSEHETKASGAHSQPSSPQMKLKPKNFWDLNQMLLSPRYSLSVSQKNN